MAPQSEAALSRTDEILVKSPSKLTSLAFGAPDLAKVHRVLGRRGGEPSEISSSFRLSDIICAGVKTLSSLKILRLQTKIFASIIW